MNFPPFVQPHPSDIALHKELRHEDLPTSGGALTPATKEAETAPQPHGSLLTARVRERVKRGPEDRRTEESMHPSTRENYSLFRHRKQDSVSSDPRDITSCRSDDASGSSISLESVGSGGPPSPMDKVGGHDFGQFPASSATIHAHQTSTPLPLNYYESNAEAFDYGNYGDDSNGLNFLNSGITDSSDHLLSHNFECADNTGITPISKPPDSFLKGIKPDSSGHDILFDGALDDTGHAVLQQHDHQGLSFSPNAFLDSLNQQAVDNANEDLMPGVQFDPNLTSALDAYPGDLTRKLEGGSEIPSSGFHQNQGQAKHLEPPHHNEPQQQQAHHQQQQLQQQLQQQQQQQHQPFQVYQPEQIGYPERKRRGLAINVPALSGQGQHQHPDQFISQQPLVPFATPLHTQLNPPLRHAERFSETGELLPHNNSLRLGHSRHGSVVGVGGQRAPEHFRTVQAHQRRMHQLRSGGSGEFFKNAFSADPLSSMDQMPMYAGADDTPPGYHGFHARNRSKSKLPLADLFAMMGLAENHPEGKRREELVMKILTDQGFELGQRTFIRDLDEPERKRIMSVVIERTKEWGYSKELLEIIVHRGVYARMQSQLRRRRRSDQRERSRRSQRQTAHNSDSRGA